MHLLQSASTKNLKDRRFFIRLATLDDKADIVKIWRADTDMLGGVQFAALNRNIANNTVHVAIADDRIIGFVDYYARQDSWQTIYHIAVDADYRGLRVGAMLLYSVPCPIRLKVTGDNQKAIAFYEHNHLTKTKTEYTKSGRSLYTYELNTLFIQCAGGNPRYPAICKNVGIAYGSRHDGTIYDYPVMIDINWRDYDWSKYMAIIKHHKPIMAMVADYESKDQYWQMRKQVHQLKYNGILRVMVCPKFDGALDDIPDDCIIALSIPSSYAGYLPDFSKLTGRRVHLLGGSVVKQRAIIKKLRGHGAIVVSVDGNGHTKTTNMMWGGGKWQKNNNHVPFFEMVEHSAKTIAKTLNTSAQYRQLKLAF